SQAIDWFIAGANTALQWEWQIRHTALSDHIPIRASLVRSNESVMIFCIKQVCVKRGRANRLNTRLYEFRNLTAKAVQRDEQELTPAMLSALCREEIGVTKGSRESLEKSQKQKTCTEWRNRLKDPSLQGLSRWLRGKDQDPAGVVVFDDLGDALDSHEVTDKINRHWRRVWAEQRQVESPTPDAIAATLVQDFGSPVAASWSEWSEQDLRVALAEASGSAGTDSPLLAPWGGAHLVPSDTTMASMWHLAPSTSYGEFSENSQNSCQSPAFCRGLPADKRDVGVLTSVRQRLSHKAREWLDSNLPTEIGSRAGAAAGAEDLASELQDALVCNGGFLASLE
ncbi:unnamed protein product, partial [Symbiodinium microadriaticum]